MTEGGLIDYLMENRSMFANEPQHITVLVVEKSGPKFISFNSDNLPWFFIKSNASNKKFLIGGLNVVDYQKDNVWFCGIFSFLMSIQQETNAAAFEKSPAFPGE